MEFREHLRHLRKLGTTRSGLVVCLILVALLAIMRVPHMHRTAAEADHCQLCVTMHTAAPVDAPAAIVVLVALGISTPVVKPKSIVRYWSPQFFTRPPPTLLQA